MLNRLSDFYRIVNLEPSDALITQRKEAISSFIEQLSNRELRYACADIAAFGLGSAPSPKARGRSEVDDRRHPRSPTFIF